MLWILSEILVEVLLAIRMMSDWIHFFKTNSCWIFCLCSSCNKKRNMRGIHAADNLDWVHTPHFMTIATASISTYVYKYVIHRIAISYAAWCAISAQNMEKRHRLLCRLTLYLYLYCIYFVLLYLWSTYMNKMCVWFTILFHI